MKKILAIILIAMTALLPSFAMAGSSEGGKSNLPAAEVAAFSNRVQQDLAARGAQVAIVARTGRDPADLPPGITYTHLAFWVYSNITAADGTRGKGYRVYNLYQRSDKDTVSRLVQDSPAEFFGGAHRLDAGVIIPDARLQRKLLKAITGPTFAKLHNANYSVLTNPADTQFQNCTEHALDVLFASLYGTSNKRQIKANIDAYFTPQTVRIGGLKRLFAPAASKALTTADHGPKVRTATFGSIARFMKKNGLVSDVYKITPTRAVRL